MASKSFQRIVCCLSWCEGLSLTIQQAYRPRPRNKTVMGMADRLHHACRDAHKCWPGDLSTAELRKIAKKMRDFEQAHLPEQDQIEILTSFCLGLLDQVQPYIADPGRVEALDRVNAALCRLHRYFDRTGRKWREYEIAGKACDAWETEWEEGRKAA